MKASPEYVFPATRGTQSGREIYLCFCPLSIATKLFRHKVAELPEKLRRDRQLNQRDVDRTAKHLLSNSGRNALLPICVSIDSDVTFEPIHEDSKLGLLRIPMSAILVVNSGDRELAALEKAAAQCPGLLADEIGVLFSADRGLKHAGKAYLDFAALATAGASGARGMQDDAVLPASLVSKLLEALPFKALVESKRSSLAPRSRMLFTVSSIIQATKALLQSTPSQEVSDRINLAGDFWATVEKQFPEWRLVRNGKMLSSELREQYVHAHAIALLAIGTAGNALVRAHPDSWKQKLEALRRIDWRRQNAKDWEGRVLVKGKVSKASANAVLTSNFIKVALGLPIDDGEAAAERALNEARAKRA